MKNMLSMLLLLCSMWGFSNNEKPSAVVKVPQKQVLVVNGSSQDVFELFHKTVVEQVTYERDSRSCTISITVYVPTEIGLVGVGFSVTANNCKEARKGAWAAAKAFLNSFR